MPRLHSISIRDPWILIKPAQIYIWEKQKSWLDFGDLGPIFKVTGCQRMLKNALSALHLQKRSIYVNKTCTDISLGNAKRVDKILMTLTPFSRSQKVKEC